MKFLIAALLLSGAAHAVAPVSNVMTTADEFALNRFMGPAAWNRSMGTKLKEAHTNAVGTWDIGTASTQQSGGPNASYNVGINLPANSIIRNIFVDQVTAFSPSVGASVSLGINTAGDLKSALTSNSWTGRMSGTPDGTVSNMIKTGSTSTQVFATVAAGAGSTLTAGKIKVYVDYVLSE